MQGSFLTLVLRTAPVLDFAKHYPEDYVFLSEFPLGLHERRFDHSMQRGVAIVGALLQRIDTIFM